MFLIALIAVAVAIAALVSARSANRRAEELLFSINSLWRELDTLRHERQGAPAAEPAPATAEAPAPAPAAGLPAGVPPPPVVEAPPPPPPPREIPVYQPPQPGTAAARENGIDWENLVGIKLFSWIGGVAAVLAAVFLFKYSVDHGWLRPAIRAAFGLIFGTAFVAACEVPAARNYKATMNAVAGAGIAILYATLFAMHARWHLVSPGAAFFGMLLVTAAAVFLSTRRDSIFIALLGLIGGFATPALLSSGENRPIALFSYLLLLNGGISWIAFRKRWPLLTALSVALTVFYQWSWVNKFLTTGQLPLAAAIFILFALVGASALWPREGDEVQPLFRRIAAAAAVVPLVFAFFTAIVPEYGAHYHVLFAYLLLMAGGLTAIAILRGPELLHGVGAIATLVTWLIWLSASYTSASWPWSLVWLAAFVALYLAAALRLPNRAMYTAGLLFFAFVGIAVDEPGRYATLIGAMLALLAVVIVFAIQKAAPYVAAWAIAFSSIAVMVTDAGLRVDLATQFVLLAALLLVAWISGRHELAVLAVPFYAAAVLSARLPTGDSMLAYAAILVAPFLLYPLLLGGRVKRALTAHLAAVFASAVFFLAGLEAFDRMRLEDWQGVFAVAVGLLMVLLTWRLLGIERHDGRLAMTAGVALAYFTAAIPLTFENEWITVAFALEAAALVWLHSRIPHRGLLLWSAMLGAAVLIRLVFNPEVFAYHPKAATPVFNWYLYTYLACAGAMFLASRLAPPAETLLRRSAAAAGVIELFFLLNIEIADYYSAGDTLTFNFMGSALAQDLTYTIAWALFAIGMLVAGIIAGSRSARVAALGLLLVTILKCFLHDLARLGGLYRVASLFGLAVCLVAVGLMLQKFVMMKRASQPTG